MYGDIFVLDAPYLQGKSSNGWWLSAPRALSSSRQVLYRLFSWPATVLSRSDYDGTGVSSSPLPVIATPGAARC